MSKTVGKILIGLAPAIESLALGGIVPVTYVPWVSFAAVVVGIVGGALGVSAPADEPELQYARDSRAPRYQRRDP